MQRRLSIGGTVQMTDRKHNSQNDLLGCDCRCCRKTSEYYGSEGVFGFMQPFPHLHSSKSWKLSLTYEFTRESHALDHVEYTKLT